MTIYVDSVAVYYKRAWCHMASDSGIQELLQFAAKIGMKPERLQTQPFLHFDLVSSKRREAALRRGAIAVESTKDLVRKCRGE
jgi:hypothetical protein